MINETDTLAPDLLHVLDGIEMKGAVNVPDEILLANVRSSIRRGHPQIRPQTPTSDRIVIVGGGPSLNDTKDELVALIREGAKLVTVNGAYQWCLERNLHPKTQIVMDARATNARFLEPAIPGCNYLLASQCAPETWEMVDGRPNVWIFHAAAGADGPLKELLDAYYLNQWFGVGGGTTVVTRAISVLRTLGYLRFDLFGVDCCFLNGEHHAYPQPENAKDTPIKFTAQAPGSDESRVFECAPWHVKQLEDFLQLIRVNGKHLLLNVHGDGMLAYALASSAGIQWTTD